MTTADDLPWPELGNVSRGATRGNQGQKGVLGLPDRDGRCDLQLRVQPGVLAVRLNRQASEWYRTLDNEVNRALKLTKTYWRKARRRQDYDARADQDHMELHEWLQQLKDKTMSHLELLMQKGDIQGPPYTMSDEIEITFLRKFIERQASGIPHNPRLRNDPSAPYPPREYSLPSDSSDTGFIDTNHGEFISCSRPHSSKGHFSRWFQHQDVSTIYFASQHRIFVPRRESSRFALPYFFFLYTTHGLCTVQGLQAARNTLARALKDTQDAFMRYTICLEAERRARQSVASAEKRRDEMSKLTPVCCQEHFSSVLSGSSYIPRSSGRQPLIAWFKYKVWCWIGLGPKAAILLGIHRGRSPKSDPIPDRRRFMWSTRPQSSHVLGCVLGYSEFY